jgi:probable rRNA maturation factor
MNNKTTLSPKDSRGDIHGNIRGDIPKDALGDIDIQIMDEKWRKNFANIDVLIKQAIKATLNHFPLPFDAPIDISVQCENDDHIKALNKGYRDKDKATNVLSFPGLDWETPATALKTPLFEGQEALLGDIVLSIETLISEAETQQKQLDHHLTHLIIHSVLHLLGFNHLEDDEAETMEQIEIDIMVNLGFSNPYQPSNKSGQPSRKAS